jgi:hypothetical protein
MGSTFGEVGRFDFLIDVPRNYVESGWKRLSHVGRASKSRSYTVENAVTWR